MRPARPPRPLHPLRPLSLAVAIALAVAACADGGGPAPDGSWAFSPAPSASLGASAPVESPAASPSAAPSTPSGPVVEAALLVVSTAIWADGGPVLVRVVDADGEPALAAGAAATVTMTPVDGGAPPVRAVASLVHSEGSASEVVYADLTPGQAGRWRLEVEAVEAGRTVRAATEVDVLDSGSTPTIGSRAPDVTTPTLADVGGTIALVTTDPQPDPRLSTTSTARARATGTPYVLVIDSWRFRVSEACGRAIPLARYLADKWADSVVFVHLEPFAYSLVSTTPVLDSPDEQPRLTPIAAAWGIGDEPWPLESVPWAFVVDGDGVVRGKTTGVFGTDEIDLVLTRFASP